jgi:sialidase-1
MPKLRALALVSACLLASLADLSGSPAAARSDAACTTTLWTSGVGGYSTYRIPAVVNTGGTLVAFAEARRNGGADNGDVQVVERRSADGGCTWTPSRVVADDRNNTVDNPVPLVAADGSLVLVTDWQLGSVTQSQIQAGKVSAANGRRIFVQISRDRGVTWTARREITKSVKRSNWLWYATGPGHGLTIHHGAAAGRLVVATDHSTPGGGQGVHTLISDNGGATWRIGAVDDHTDGAIAPDETTVAELPDGRLYFSSRNQISSSSQAARTKAARAQAARTQTARSQAARHQAGPRPSGHGRASRKRSSRTGSATSAVHRTYTFSLSSGSTFSAPFRPAPALVTPIVEGSLLQDPGLPSGVSCAPLLFSGPESPSIRQHLTVRRSDDGGRTWRDIAELTGPTVPAAYSDMVKVDRSRLGVLYETGSRGPYERIDWRTFTLGCP